jgi:hypothetical protein
MHACACIYACIHIKPLRYGSASVALSKTPKLVRSCHFPHLFTCIHTHTHTYMTCTKPLIYCSASAALLQTPKAGANLLLCSHIFTCMHAYMTWAKPLRHGSVLAALSETPSWCDLLLRFSYVLVYMHACACIYACIHVRHAPNHQDTALSRRPFQRLPTWCHFVSFLICACIHACMRVYICMHTYKACAKPPTHGSISAALFQKAGANLSLFSYMRAYRHTYIHTYSHR